MTTKSLTKSLTKKPRPNPKADTHEGHYATFKVDYDKGKGGWAWQTHEGDDAGGPFSTSKKAFDNASKKYQDY